MRSRLSLRMITTFSFGVLVLSDLIIAQSLIIPSAWNSTTLDDNLSQRVSLVQSAINVALQNYNSSNGLFNDGVAWGTPAIFYAELALFDRYMNQTQHHDLVLTGMRNALSSANYLTQGGPVLDFNGIWGIANLEAYLSYGDSEFLASAQGVWEFLNQFVITPSEVSARSAPPQTGSNATIKGACTPQTTISGSSDPTTLAGGLVQSTNFSDPSLYAIATGTYTILSALLADATSNITYKEVALESANFMLNQLYTSDFFVLKNIDSTDCSLDKGILSHNTGVLLRALGILNISNSQFDNELLSTIAAATTTSRWLTPTGIILGIPARGQPPIQFRDVHLFRGLLEVYLRNDSSGDVEAYLKAFLSIQYNAARAASIHDIYAFDWSGLPPVKFSSDGQVAGLAALVASLKFGNVDVDGMTSSSSVPEPTTASSKQSSSKGSHTGKIVGGVLGGLIGLILTIGIALCIVRNCRQIPTQEPEALQVTPLRIPNEQTQGPPVPPRPINPQSVYVSSKRSGPLIPFQSDSEMIRSATSEGSSLAVRGKSALVTESQSLQSNAGPPPRYTPA